MPDPDALLTLESEELAGVGLELLAQTDPITASRLHPSSFSHPDTIGNYPGQKLQQITLMLMEVWSWLLQEGIIAPTGDNFGWHFITRRGNKLRNCEGLVAYRNIVLLPRKLLHPVIC
jgi:hypothetical protein